MDIPIITCVIIILLGLALSAVFSGFENGMIAIRQARLNHAVKEKQFLAKLLKYFLDRPAIMLATILLGNNLCNVCTTFFLDGLVDNSIISMNLPNALIIFIKICVAVFLTIAILIFGEITPKVWFRQQPFNRCRLVVFPMYVFHIVMYVLVWLLTLVVKMLNHFIPGQKTNELVMMREDFRHMLRESENDGLILRESRVLLENSIDYHRLSVADIMIFKNDVKSLSSDMTIKQAVTYASGMKISRFPVFHPQDPEKWIGIFTLYDAIFRIKESDWENKTIKENIRPLLSVPQESKPNDVLQRSQTARSPMLAVVNQSNEFIGIITANDVLKPLFGDLEVL